MALLDHNINNAILARAVGCDLKGKLSIIIYIATVSLSFIHPYIGCALYIFLAAMWPVPDKRI